MIVLVFPILAKVCVSESVQIILENDCGNDWGRTIVVQGLFNLRNEVGIRLVSFHCICSSLRSITVVLKLLSFGHEVCRSPSGGLHFLVLQ